MTDIELLEEYKEGNTEAFQEFYTRYKDSLYTFLRNRSGDKADDLFQDTFIKFINALSKKKIYNPKAYLFQIAINLVRNAYRNPKHVTLDIIQEIPEKEYEDEELPVTEEELQQSLAELARKKPDFYDVLHLHIFEKMTFDQISDLKERNRNTVSSQYRYAIHYLRKLLKPAVNLHLKMNEV
jgi:RNA polymerase sigma-70 factor (ECF subfamily)